MPVLLDKICGKEWSSEQCEWRRSDQAVKAYVLMIPIFIYTNERVTIRN
jgi:hypothetical protein